jgi:hypothetical protein
MVIGRSVAASPSLYPDDPESKHFDPRVFVDEAPPGHDGDSHHDGAPRHNDKVGRLGPAANPSEDDVLVFLRRILDEARSKRRDMVTHYTADDLRVALGFARPRADEGGERPAGSSHEATANPTSSRGES